MTLIWLDGAESNVTPNLQPLAPGERKLMPVQFYVDPELPARFKNLTLSYRLYRSVGQTSPLPLMLRGHWSGPWMNARSHSK